MSLRPCRWLQQGMVVWIMNASHKVQPIKVSLTAETAGLRLIPRASWGGDRVHLFGFDTC